MNARSGVSRGTSGASPGIDIHLGLTSARGSCASPYTVTPDDTNGTCRSLGASGVRLAEFRYGPH
jgi:hypothetical protein